MSSVLPLLTAMEHSSLARDSGVAPGGALSKKSDTKQKKVSVSRNVYYVHIQSNRQR